MDINQLIKDYDIKKFNIFKSININKIDVFDENLSTTDLLVIRYEDFKSLKNNDIDFKILALIHDKEIDYKDPYILINPKINLPKLLLSWMNKISEEQTYLLEENEIINNAFMKMNVEQANVEDYVDFLGQILNKDIIYHGKLDHATYFYGEKFLEDEEIENIKLVDNDLFIERIEKNNNVYAYLIINDRKTNVNNKDKLLIKYSSSMILLKIQNQIAIDKSKEIVRSDLIADLCMNNIKSREEVIFRANLQGWRIQSSGILAIIFDIDEFKHSMLHSNKDIKELEEEKQIIYKLIIKEMEKINYTSYYYQKSDSIIFLVNLDLENNLSALDKFVNLNIKPIHDLMKKKGLSFTLTIGIGTYYEDIMQAYRSYNEAIEAINISRIFKEVDDISCYKDVLIFKDLMEVMTRKDYHSIYTDLIENIIELDKKNKTEYFITLRSIIKNDWNLKESSKDLFIHYNTILYRFEKLKKLLAMELDEFYQKLIITLTVMMLEVEKHIDFNKGMFKK